jgi:hypothetical protein
MLFFIFNTTADVIEESTIKNYNHSQRIVEVMSTILGEEPDFEYSDEDDPALTVYLTSEEINKLLDHAKGADGDLAQIFSVDQLGRLQGNKNIH